MKKLLLFVLLALGVISAPAKADQTQTLAFIVSACGTLPSGLTYAAGTYGIVTMDTTGELCDSATGGGGGSGTLPVGAANFVPAQVSVGSTATLIAAARTGAAGTGRVAVTVVQAGTTPVYLGGSGVTTSTGTLLPGILGSTATINTTAAIYGIVSTGSETVTEFETY